MVIHATFRNISAVSWLSVLLVEETGVPRENHRPVASHWQTLSHNVISSTPRQLLVVIGRYCTVTCKSTTIRSRPRRPFKTKQSMKNLIAIIKTWDLHWHRGTLLLLLRHEIYTDTGEPFGHPSSQFHNSNNKHLLNIFFVFMVFFCIFMIISWLLVSMEEKGFDI